MKKTKRVKKASGNRAAGIAGTFLRAIRDGGRLYWSGTAKDDATRFVKVLAASVLSQDETRGQRK